MTNITSDNYPTFIPMNYHRWKQFFLYAMGIWLVAPVLLHLPMKDYTVFLVKGIGFSIVLACMFYGLDLLANRLIRRLKGNK